MTAETTGWLGLGFSPNGGMTKADIVVAWVDDRGKVFILVSENSYCKRVNYKEVLFVAFIMN